ncbi:MAG TPA: PTS sugar transporter subunit IIB [Anaerolineae bacterium]
MPSDTQSTIPDEHAALSALTKEVSAIKDFGLVRIDDRLIHGQVIIVWRRHRTFTRIVIVDDGVAADPFMQEVLKMAAPPDLQVEVYSVAQGIAVLTQDRVDRETTMVLVRSPQVARQLFDGGVIYRALNVGGLGLAPGRKNVFKSISISDDEIAILKYLMENGVDIAFYSVPGEKPKMLGDLIHRGNR